MSPSAPGTDARAAALALAAGAAAALAGTLGLALVLDDAAQRGLHAFRHSQPAPVVVLGIDARDPWPWPSQRLATLLERLRMAGVRGIGLDLPIATEASADATGDARLTRALLEGPVTLGVALEPRPDGTARAQLPPVEFADAARLGHLRLPRDRDGRIRRHLPQVRAEDGIQWPSLARTMADTAGVGLGRDADAPWQVIDADDVPPIRSAVGPLEDGVDLQGLQGRWVLIGLADPSRQARLPGPHGSAALFPVQHQARALAALLRSDTPRPLPAAFQALLAMLLAGGATCAGLSGKGPAWRMPMALLAGIGVSLSVSAWLLGRQHWFAPGATVGVLVIGLLAWTAAAVHRQWRARRHLPGLATRHQLQAAVQATGSAGTPHALLVLESSPADARSRGRADAGAQQVADLLRTRARRPEDVAAWLGGSRFALLLHGTSAAAAQGILDQIREQATDRGLALRSDMRACATGDCGCQRHLDTAASAPR